MATRASFFRPINRAFMAVLRSPVGRLVHSPVVGYLAVLTTTGRRSGRPRAFPLSYALLNGNVYVMAGYGRGSDWFRNLEADPSVTVELPGRVVHGIAEEVTDPEEDVAARTAVVRNSGAAVFSLGLNPFTLTADQVKAVDFEDRPMVRVRSARPVNSGMWDRHGRGWLLAHVMAPAVVLLALRFLRRRRR